MATQFYRRKNEQGVDDLVEVGTDRRIGSTEFGPYGKKTVTPC